MSGTFSYFYYPFSHVKDLQECDKLFITTDSDDWNPHRKSFEKNKNAMNNFEGDIVENERRTDHEMDIIDDSDMFQT